MDEERSILPESRIKELIERSNCEVNNTIPVQKYFHSGDQIVRQADVYLQQDDLERAFVLYMKFSSIFAEKVRQHPEYRNVTRETKFQTIQKLKVVIEKTENLKEKLLQIYRDEYNQYLQKREKLRLLEVNQEGGNEEKEEKNEKSLNVGSPSRDSSAGIRESTVDMNMVKPVSYLPDNFLVYEIPENSTTSRPEKLNCIKKTTKPGVDRSTKPKIALSDRLRTIDVPSVMLQKFLHLAQQNTNNNTETCGILAGKLNFNKFVITHLLIPKQCGSSDSCTTNNEEDLFIYQDEHNLITLGWIHTHPSQTAFLSSVDLHTHYAYQLMMPEAIAIVCAPRYSQTRFFHLTPKYGLDYIGNCQQQGFHPHPSDPPLFQDSEHCELNHSAQIEVVDMR